MAKKLSCNVSVHEEEMNGNKIFVVECSELDINDFGENLDEALHNLKNAIKLLLEEAQKRELY